MGSIWGEEFDIPETPVKTKKIVQKISKPKSPQVVSGASSMKKLSLTEKLACIQTEVMRVLGRYENTTQVITRREDLHAYISQAIENNIIAVDTETNNSLDPLTCKLMGLCIYTCNEKNVYVPINHVDSSTGERLLEQLTEQDVYEELNRVKDITIIMHNGKFDYEVLKCTTGIVLPITWDTMIGAKVLDENEKSAGLKQQYIEKIDSSVEKYSIDHLFEAIEYAVVPYSIFALYAATDSFMTYKLYEWQKKQFEKPENSKLYNLFQTVEMPVVSIAAEMELSGVCIDIEYAKRLSIKYHDKVAKVDDAISQELQKYSDAIAAWRLTPAANEHPMNKSGTGEGKSKSEQLSEPISVTSPTQLAILLYDILGQKSSDSKKSRGTGEDILSQIDLPICKLILEKRGLEKLIGTYIDKLPACISPADNRLHAKFNQYGAATGRFSSSEPNLQNIPSHEKSIRLMFTASEGNVLVGSDYSQQEPRLLAYYSQDDKLIDAYANNKDLYATVAADVYHNSYEDNQEHFSDGTANPEGKKRRSSCKSLILGLMYGRGVASIAEQIGGSFAEAQKITDDFFNAYPKVKIWIEQTKHDAYKLGYVEDLCGRRRRLPDIQLDKYTAKMLKTSTTFNPLLNCDVMVSSGDDALLTKYLGQASKVRGRNEFESLRFKALHDNVELKDNSGFIADAERQSVNARVQGGAASLSKCAMIAVANDEELQSYGFRMLICVHDEIIGECKQEYSEPCAKRLCDIMKSAAKQICSVPMKCDATIESSWYFSDFGSEIQEEAKKLLKDHSPDNVFELLLAEHSELCAEQLHQFIDEVLYK